MNTTPEQAARDMLERLEIEDAQSLSAGDVVELANLIAEADRLRRLCARAADELSNYWDDGPVGQGWQSKKLIAFIKELRQASKDR